MTIPRLTRLLAAWIGLSVVMACAGPQTPGGYYDPYELQNRAVHDFNVGVDRMLLRPASNLYGQGIPKPVRNGINNFSSNLALPSSIVNDVLQAKFDDALHNTVRFIVNTTIGLGGVFDPALASGVEPRKTDFGETLHVWGLKEGAYLELPFFGPSTTRDTVGKVVDIAINPVTYLLPSPERYAAPVAALGKKINNRYRFSTTVDSVLYDSPDSYAQSRLLYLENRRFQLGQSANGESEDITNEGLYDDLIPQ